MQYTIRNMPDRLDAALRSSAREKGKSLNEVTLEALTLGTGISGHHRQQRDLSDIAGSWREDSAFDTAIADRDLIDADLWR